MNNSEFDERLIHEAVRERLFGGKRVPLRIGRFVVLRKLGAGGMGTVYVAHDEQLAREVAVKLLHPQIDRGVGMTRILREAQALARLSHPNVVQVHEVGEHEGSMFVAMELVVGQSLREWLAPERPWQEILAVLIQCGRGLEAAHLAGLVHRDFKPDNAIVGADGRVRVLDFGLVRAHAEVSTTEPSLEPTNLERNGSTLHDALTSTGAVLGTPAYMAPEQLAGETCDALADQFSFCVVAFETLFGERPFRGTTLEQLRANVLAGEMRHIPSDTAVPGRVCKAITRGLQVATETRWPSMSELIAELESGLDRGRGRRSWWSLGLGAVMGVALVGGLALPLLVDETAPPCAIDDSALAGTWDAAQRERLRNAFMATPLSFAATISATVENQLDAWASRWTDAQREACEATHLAHVQSEAVLDRRRACLDRVRRDLDAIIELWLAADVELVGNAPHLLARLPEIDICSGDPRAPQASKRPIEADAARDQIARARALLHAGKLDDADVILAPLGQLVDTLDEPSLSLELQAFAGALRFARGQMDAGAELFQAAIHTARERGLDEIEADMRTELARAVAGSWAKPELEALVLSEAEAAVHRIGRRSDPREIDLLVSRAYLQAFAGAHEAALASFHQARELAEVHNQVRAGLLRIETGNVLMQRGDYQAARVEYDAAREFVGESSGPRSPLMAALLQDIAMLATLRGQPDEAELLLREAMAITREIHGEDSLPLARIRVAMAEAAMSLGALDEAVTELGLALAVFERELGPTHDLTGAAYNGLGVVKFWLEDYAGSLAAYEHAQISYTKVYGNQHPEWALLRSNMGETLVALGQHERALEAFAEATAVFDRTLPSNHPYQVLPAKGRGMALLGLGRGEDAVASLTRALAIQALLPEDPLELADIRFGLARALRLTGRERERARQLAQQAHDGFAAQRVTGRTAVVQQWLNDLDP